MRAKKNIPAISVIAIDSQPSNGGSAKSALLLEADIGSAGGHVGFVPPTGDIACLA